HAQTPQADIDKTISLTLSDILLTIMGLVLLSTDVVRSGLCTMNIYKRVEPNNPTVKLWSYKYDTLSIPSRTLVANLNESLYPPCVLYRSKCEDPL
ncbi:TPA: hypothetical protein N0F65_004642, partial [Lagenidium giganteum]